MASPAAYEPSSLTKAWQVFLAHVPTMLLIWVTTAVISAMGFAVYMAINVIAYVAGGMAGLIQSVSQALLPGLRAWVEVCGMASSLCPIAMPPQPIST